MGPVPQPEEERDHPNHDGNDIEDAEHPDIVINVDLSDSDSDDEDDVHGGYMGYQALAQDAVNQDFDSDDDDSQNEGVVQDVDSDSQNASGSVHGPVECNVPEGLVHQVRHSDYPNTANLPGYMQVPDIPKPDRKDLLWNQHRQPDIPIETGQADKILSVMSNIQLPSAHIPDWARSLSEDQWQLQVVNKLVKQKTCAKNNSDANMDASQITSDSALTNETTEATEVVSGVDGEKLKS